MARRGYGRVQAAGLLSETWRKAAGDEFGSQTRPGQVRRGVLEVTVGNSILAQEISFQKGALLKKLAELAPDEKIRDLRFRVGPIE